MLVAEDNPINQATLRNQLEQLGCTVTVASDGADALSLWPLTQYDALLTDVNMPKLNGYELASALRAQGAVIPIIGVTANAMRDEEERCMAAGMSSWMVKPIELRTLRQLLRGVARPHAPASPEPKPAMTTLLLASPPAPASASRQVQASAPATEAPQVPAKYRELFLDTMNADLAKIDAALGRQDVLAVLQTMHRMRGALVMVKMNSLSAGFEAVEAQPSATARTGKPSRKRPG